MLIFRLKCISIARKTRTIKPKALDPVIPLYHRSSHKTITRYVLLVFWSFHNGRFCLLFVLSLNGRLNITNHFILSFLLLPKQIYLSISNHEVQYSIKASCSHWGITCHIVVLVYMLSWLLSIVHWKTTVIVAVVSPLTGSTAIYCCGCRSIGRLIRNSSFWQWWSFLPKRYHQSPCCCWCHQRQWWDLAFHRYWQWWRFDSAETV